MEGSVGIAPRGVEIRLLGPIEVRRGASVVALPQSRKARGLLAFIAMAPGPVARAQLCDLLWDGPGDPRGELRWCLSKLRGLVDDADGVRLRSSEGTVWLDSKLTMIDACEIQAALAAAKPLDRSIVAGLLSRFAGGFAEGLEVERCPVFEAWLAAQRRRFLDARIALLQRLAAIGTDDERIDACEQWVQLAPLDAKAHAGLIAALAVSSRFHESEEHLERATRLFEAERLDVRPLRDAWREARLQPPSRIVIAPEPWPSQHVPPEATALPGRRRPSFAVMPFDAGRRQGHQGMGRALAHDIVSRLAKLRTLFVIAQGSTQALHERGIGPVDAGRMLEVDYLAGGSIRSDGKGLRVEVQLTEPRTARILWADTIVEPGGDALRLLDAIGNRIVASIANEIETEERNRAILRPPDALDAWQAYHRGLWHAYRFTRDDNQRAAHFFETAVRIDPTFARAHAGVSFVHFQNAFQGWDGREREVERAYAAASQALLADDRDPAAHWAMGRALWIGGSDRALVELEQAVELSPNFAQGHYALAFVQAQSGDAAAAVRAADHSRQLSPFDPMLFAMLASRGLALARLGRLDEAASCSAQAASRPNAHVHIRAIAALNLAMAGSLVEAKAQVAALRAAVPGYGMDDFLRAFRLDPDAEAMYRRCAPAAGLA